MEQLIEVATALIVGAVLWWLFPEYRDRQGGKPNDSDYPNAA